MVKITKVYTRTGDTGITGLAGGTRISKSSALINAIGDVDELNSTMSLVGVTAMEFQSQLQEILQKCLRIKHGLFNLGAELAVPFRDRRENTPCITADMVNQLEQEIDEMNSYLTPLTSFILPGGCEIAARLHLARSVCRRSERSLIRISSKEKNLGEYIIPYINRLSDWLFVAARYTMYRLNIKEILWDPSIT